MAATKASERKRLFVVAALIESRGRILLSQRRPDQTFPLCWEFPGGKVEPGESPQMALVREIHEELGCMVRVGAIAELVFHSYPDFDLVMPVYRAVVREGKPRALDVHALAWVPRRSLLRRTMPPADIPFASRLARSARATRTRGRR